MSLARSDGEEAPGTVPEGPGTVRIGEVRHAVGLTWLQPDEQRGRKYSAGDLRKWAENFGRRRKADFMALRHGPQLLQAGFGSVAAGHLADTPSLAMRVSETWLSNRLAWLICVEIDEPGDAGGWWVCTGRQQHIDPDGDRLFREEKDARNFVERRLIEAGPEGHGYLALPPQWPVRSRAADPLTYPDFLRHIGAGGADMGIDRYWKLRKIGGSGIGGTWVFRLLTGALILFIAWQIVPENWYRAKPPPRPTAPAPPRVTAPPPLAPRVPVNHAVWRDQPHAGALWRACRDLLDRYDRPPPGWTINSRGCGQAEIGGIIVWAASLGIQRTSGAAGDLQRLYASFDPGLGLDRAQTPAEDRGGPDSPGRLAIRFDDQFASARLDISLPGTGPFPGQGVAGGETTPVLLGSRESRLLLADALQRLGGNYSIKPVTSEVTPARAASGAARDTGQAGTIPPYTGFSWKGRIRLDTVLDVVDQPGLVIETIEIAGKGAGATVNARIYHAEN